jgi:hypothetical protein
MANPNPHPEQQGTYRRSSDLFIVFSLLGNAVIVMASFVAIWSQISGALIASERRSTILETKVDSIIDQNRNWNARYEKIEERVLDLEKEASAK